MELNLAYDLTAWTGFFTGASAAAGVLLGLMLTAVTVAQTRIEHGRDLAVRAYVLLAALFDALAVSLWPLAPFPRVVIGLLVLVFGADVLRNFVIYLFAPSWLPGTRDRTRAAKSSWSKQGSEPWWAGPALATSWLTIALGPIPIVVGGISLAAHAGGGLYWEAPGLVMTLGYVLIFLWGVMFGPQSANQPGKSS
jgi:hypothetical protein